MELLAAFSCWLAGGTAATRPKAAPAQCPDDVDLGQPRRVGSGRRCARAMPRQAVHAPQLLPLGAGGSCGDVPYRGRDPAPVLPLWGRGARSDNRAAVALLLSGVRGLLLLLGPELPPVSKDCSQTISAGSGS